MSNEDYRFCAGWDDGSRAIQGERQPRRNDNVLQSRDYLEGYLTGRDTTERVLLERSGCNAGTDRN